MNDTNERTTVDRTPRETQTREALSREVDSVYRPPSTLPDPKPSDVWVYRWIRMSTYGEADSTNTWQRHAEGWEFVSPKEVPEIASVLPIPPGKDFIEV